MKVDANWILRSSPRCRAALGWTAEGGCPYATTRSRSAHTIGVEHIPEGDYAFQLVHITAVHNR